MRETVLRPMGFSSYAVGRVRASRDRRVPADSASEMSLDSTFSFLYVSV